MLFCTNFIYVPITGCISPGTDRNQVGPLPMHSSSAGGATRPRARWSLAVSWYYLLLQNLCIPDKSIGARPDLSRGGSLLTPLHLSSELHLGCRNPADPEVRPYALYQ